MTRPIINVARGYTAARVNALDLGAQPLRRHDSGCACLECRTAAKAHDKVDRDSIEELVREVIAEEFARLRDDTSLIDNAASGSVGYAPPRLLLAGKRQPNPMTVAERRALDGMGGSTGDRAYVPPNVLLAPPRSSKDGATRNRRGSGNEPLRSPGIDRNWRRGRGGRDAA